MRAVLLLALLLAPLARAAGPSLQLTPHTLEASDGRKVEVELGTLSVPLRHAKPGGASLPLHFVRFRSTARKPGAPIVYLAGGPGGSGIEAARGPRLELFLALRAQGDVLALDQRGTGRSDLHPELKGRPWGVPLEAPVDAESLAAAMKHALAEAGPAWAAAGVDVGAYTTAESAEDLESLRRALGVPRLRLWGISYGTHLGLAYLKKHPARVERAVLAGVEGPDDTWKRPSRADAVLARWDAVLASQGHTGPPLAARLEALLAPLRQAPRRVTFRDPRTGAEGVWMASALDVQRAAFEMLRDPAMFGRFLMLLGALEAGAFEVMGPLVSRVRGGVLEPMPVAMDAASGASAERREQVAREAAASVLGGAPNAGVPEAAWLPGVEDLGEAFRAPVRASVPVLLISGTLDGRTGPENAEAVREGLPRAVHLVLEGAGHEGLFQSDPRILARMQRFLSGAPVRDERLVVPVALPGAGPGASAGGTPPGR